MSHPADANPHSRPDQQTLCHHRATHHPYCFVGSPHNPAGLNLDFAVDGDDAIHATCTFTNHHQGYNDTVHGGVVCAVLDGAMTNCLFAHGIAAVTALLEVRFRHPVRTHTPGHVHANIVRRRGTTYILHATLSQAGRPVATASATFMRHTAATHTADEHHHAP